MKLCDTQNTYVTVTYVTVTNVTVTYVTVTYVTPTQSQGWEQGIQ